MDNKFSQMILDELKSLNKKQDKLQDGLTTLNTGFELHKKESEHRWETIAKLDAEQNQILAEHRSTGLAQQEANRIAREKLQLEIDQVKEKVTVLEEPGKFMGNLKSVILYGAAVVGGVGTIVAGITKFLNMW